MLTLEPAPIISSDLDKGKGLVFSYERVQEDNWVKQVISGQDKLMQSAIQSGHANMRHSLHKEDQMEENVKKKSDKEFPLIYEKKKGLLVGKAEKKKPLVKQEKGN
ncbi:unnamed protein product [Arabis nemorensis]|uniref:Uncharacterized protein n=1 Tax=Arabis nemorensis TaxID=586526 RepID=A0A565BKX1_9BRAS|nr:unnamed protein product [Arabis nemorensis]